MCVASVFAAGIGAALLALNLESGDMDAIGRNPDLLPVADKVLAAARAFDFSLADGSTAILQTGMKAMLPALERVKSEDRAEKVYKPTSKSNVRPPQEAGPE